MRRSLRVLSGAPEFVSSLLSSGRFADMAMLNHFTNAVETEVSNSSAGASSATTPVALQNPRTWVGEVYGLRDWYTSPESPGSFQVRRQPNGKYVVSGAKRSVGGDGSKANALPASVVTVAQVEDGQSQTVTKVLIPVPAQPSSTCKVVPLGLGVQVNVTVKDHECTVLPSKEGDNLPDAATAELCNKRLEYCRSVSRVIQSLEHVCALHVTSTKRFDSLLLRDQQAQRTLALLRSSAFAIDALVSYAASSENASDVTFAKMYASNALQYCTQAAKAVVGPAISNEGKHSADESIAIKYDYVHQVASWMPELLHLDGWKSDLANFVLSDCLHPSGALQRFAVSNPMSAVFGGSNKNMVRLTSPHLNLSISAQTVESDVTSFLQVVAKKVSTAAKASSDDVVVFRTFVADYMAEIMATTACLYRCTAALTVDEDKLGQREWLWTQAVCDFSRARRAALMSRFTMDETSTKGVWSSLSDKDYDEVAVHPVELGMMKAKASSSATSTTTQQAKAAPKA